MPNTTIARLMNEVMEEFQLLEDKVERQREEIERLRGRRPGRKGSQRSHSRSRSPHRPREKTITRGGDRGQHISPLNRVNPRRNDKQARLPTTTSHATDLKPPLFPTASIKSDSNPHQPPSTIFPTASLKSDSNLHQPPSSIIGTASLANDANLHKNRPSIIPTPSSLTCHSVTISSSYGNHTPCLIEDLPSTSAHPFGFISPTTVTSTSSHAQPVDSSTSRERWIRATSPLISPATVTSTYSHAQPVASSTSRESWIRATSPLISPATVTSTYSHAQPVGSSTSGESWVRPTSPLSLLSELENAIKKVSPSNEAPCHMEGVEYGHESEGTLFPELSQAEIDSYPLND